jgi:hypothetical protein
LRFLSNSKQPRFFAIIDLFPPETALFSLVGPFTPREKPKTRPEMGKQPEMSFAE